METNEMAERLLRRFMEECFLSEPGMALIDSGWTSVTEEERAYLRALKARPVDAGQQFQSGARS